jgi:hypothetical protein
MNRKIDWSSVKEKIKVLEPGEVVIVICPAGKDFKSFRSAVIVSGGRLHKGEWKFATRTDGKKLHCFLAPR